MSLSGQTVLQSWSFEDGIDLETTSNAGTGTTSWTSPPVGTLEIDTASQSYRSFGDIQGNQAIGTFGSPHTSGDSPAGIISLEAVVSGWDMSAFDGTNTLRSFTLTVQDSSNSPVGRFLVQYTEDQVRFRFQTDVAATENLFVGTAAGNNLNLVNTNTSYTLRAEIDFAGGTITHFLNDQEVGSITENTPGELATLDLNRLVFNNFGPGGQASFDQPDAVVQWDSVTLTAIPEPSTYAAIFGLAALAFIAVRRRRS